MYECALIKRINNDTSFIPSLSCSQRGSTDVRNNTVAFRPSRIGFETQEHLCTQRPCSFSSEKTTGLKCLHSCPRECSRSYPKILTASVSYGDWYRSKEFSVFIIMLAFYVMISFFNTSFLTSSPLCKISKSTFCKFSSRNNKPITWVQFGLLL